MRLALVSDAWFPQVNGVVTTLERTVAELTGLGVKTHVIEPGRFRTIAAPSYPEIRLAVDVPRVAGLLRELRPDAVHIATEGPLGLAARHAMLRWGLPFSTSLHTRFPDYVNVRWRIPLAWGYRYLRWFHRPAAVTLVTTPTQQRELAARGFEHLQTWGRGVDVTTFRPIPRGPHPRPRLLYVGRVAVEKNLRAFLDLPVPGSKIVVGDGPQRAELERDYADVEFLGYKRGAELARCYADADVLVFPSLTDTFGLVMLEANACGTPVAAYPVPGPIDVISEGVNGALDEDLAAAVRRALRIERGRCRAFAESHSWRRATARFAAALVRIGWQDREPARWRRRERLIDGGASRR